MTNSNNQWLSWNKIQVLWWLVLHSYFHSTPNLFWLSEWLNVPKSYIWVDPCKRTWLNMNGTHFFMTCTDVLIRLGQTKSKILRDRRVFMRGQKEGHAKGTRSQFRLRYDSNNPEDEGGQRAKGGGALGHNLCEHHTCFPKPVPCRSFRFMLFFLKS